MKRMARPFVIGVLLLTGCSGAFPDEALRDHPNISTVGQKSPVMERFAALDANGDGVLQRDEAEGHWTEIFDIMDARGDGRITAAEFMALPNRRMAVRDQLMIMNDPVRYAAFIRLDRGGKGYVTLDDFLSGQDILFDLLDRDHDGTLSPDELGIVVRFQPVDSGNLRFPPPPPPQLPATQVPAAPTAAAATIPAPASAAPKAPVASPASTDAGAPPRPPVKAPVVDNGPPPAPRIIAPTVDNGPPPPPRVIAPTVDNGPPSAPVDH